MGSPIQTVDSEYDPIDSDEKMVKSCDTKKIDSGVRVSIDETTDLNNTSSDNLHSVSSVERRRQLNKYHTLSNKSSSSKRKKLRYNIDKYKLSKSEKKIKRRLQQQETPTPSEKVLAIFV